jgi:hypothetical protein
MTVRDEHGAVPREADPHAGSGQPTAYQSRITGQLGSRWADWFEGLTITTDGDDTLITGPVVDQAALQGLLRRVRDLGMPLVSVNPVEPGPPTLGAGPADASDVGSNAGGGEQLTPKSTRKGDTG